MLFFLMGKLSHRGTLCPKVTDLISGQARAGTEAFLLP